MSVDCSIEYCHITTSFPDLEAWEVETTLARKVARQYDSSQRVVLIDDYNFPQLANDTEHLLAALSFLECAPSAVVFESSCTTIAEEIIDTITVPRLRNQLGRYIDKRGSYPCSLMTAAWYLARLGHAQLSKNACCIGVVQPAGQLTNILPLQYQSVEYAAQQILAALPCARIAERIETRWIATPMVSVVTA